MDTLAIVTLLVSIWLVVDAVLGIWHTRNLFFTWQFIGISLARLPLETLLEACCWGCTFGLKRYCR
jgi:hypothetical protein